MYRPGTDPQYRPRAAVPPPPPPGMMNYVPPRQMPPPIHGRPYPMPQFSYGSVSPAPPSSLHVPTHLSSGLPMQPPPPGAGPPVPPFVPPLPSDLPPPPPSSPPPPPPPLPSEVFIPTNFPPKHMAHDMEREEVMSASLPELKRQGETKIGAGISNGLQQQRSCPHSQSEAGKRPTSCLDSKNVLEGQQLYSDWNSTYLDTLDEDEAASPATSDMDMDMEDAEHMSASQTQVSADVGMISSAGHHPLPFGGNRETSPSYVFVSNNTESHCRDDVEHTATPKIVPGPTEFSLKDRETLQLKHEGHTVKDFSSLHVVSEGGSSCTEQRFLTEHRRARLSRWGSPPPLHAVPNESQHKEEDNNSLACGIGELRRLDKISDAVDQGPKISAKADGDFSASLQQSTGGSTTKETNAVRGTMVDSSQLEQAQNKIPAVDEDGRLLEEAASGSGPEGEVCHLPVDEFGRLVHKGESGSESEGDRRAYKRKRSRGRGRSRSRRSSSRSGSESRSRSRRSSSRSRSRSSSRSPASSSRETRRRRRSFSRSPRRKMRWSKSRSRSPQWRRSYSRTPPRDMRWGGIGRGERDWRADRDHFGRGRRGGRGSGPNPCFHFARGRCNRGNACRYLHVTRETGMQDRGAWRRDTQPERHNLDAGREDYIGDKQTRVQWRRDPWVERQETFGGRLQDFHVENQEREAVLSSKMLQEDAGGESLSNKVAIPPSKGEIWTPRNPFDAKDIQDMAYNKALELVGIPHMPMVVAEDAVIVNDKAQFAEKESDYRKVSEQCAIVEASSDMTSEAPRNAASTKLAEDPAMVESIGCRRGNLLSEESVLEKNDTVRESDCFKLEASNEETEFLHMKEQDCVTNLEGSEDVGVVGEGARVIQEADTKIRVLKSTKEEYLPEADDEAANINSKIEATEHLVLNKGGDDLSASLPLDATGKSQEPLKQESSPKTGITRSGTEGDDNLVLEKVGELSASAELEHLPADMDTGPVLEANAPKDVSKAEATKESEATGLIEVTAIEGGLQASEAEALGRTNVQFLKILKSDGIRTSDSTSEVSVPPEGEPHATANEMVENSAVQLPARTPQGPQQVLSGQPVPGIPLRSPSSQVQQHICTGQPISAPLLPPPSQGPLHSSIDQPNAYVCPPGSVQHPAFPGNFARPTQYASLRPPPNSQPLDQASRPRAKFNSGTTGYQPAVGWGQQTFQPRPPTQELAPFNQLHGPLNYGTSIRHSHGPSTSGAPFYGLLDHGDKFPQHLGAPYSGDLFPQYHQPPNPGDQYPQHYRPPNPGGYGQNNQGGYGPMSSAGVGPINSGPTNAGGFGLPNTGGPSVQHLGSSSSGAPFSQHYMVSSPAGPFPQHPPPQSHRPPCHGSPFLSQPVPQSYGQPNQPTYGPSVPAQLLNQGLASTQPPGNVNQFTNLSMNSQQQVAPTQQQGCGSNTSFLPEQSQSAHPFAGATANQMMQPNVVNAGLSSTPALSLAHGNTPWNFQASQKPALPPSGQSLAYSYPLTTVPPLSGLVPISQATKSPLQNDQYDPLSDISASGMDGASKPPLVKPLLDGRVSLGVGTAPLASHAANDNQDTNKPKKAHVLASRAETVEADSKNVNEDVGMVENMSPENWSPVPAAEGKETGQEQALSKKSSRGLKMLRTAIADHVKEVLKPTWREGYMSKEAFKTIAKKAVEKVVGNLPSHHIPKSQEKVDQFMKASGPKISKLVQGYVDKYLKL